MKILITGHKGYIGSVLIPLLQQAGHHLTGMDTDLYGACDFGPPAVEIPNISKDIRDAEVEDLLGYDAIIHLAGLSNDPLGNLDPGLTDAINFKASVRLAQLAKAAQVPRYIFSSSCSNYGAAGEEMVDEASVLNPVTPYGRSKVMTEQHVMPLADEKFHPSFLRHGTAYGFSPRIRFDLVVNNLVAWAFTTGEVFIKSDGTPWRPLVHIEDISKAFLAVLESPAEKIHNQVFNVGITTENYRVKELAQIVQETVPGSKVIFAKDGGPDKRCYRVNFNKISRTLPEFKPSWTVRRGVQELYEAYQRIGIEVEDFEGKRFNRIDHIKSQLKSGNLDKSLRWKKEKVLN